jgi:hypothetical protein
MEMLTRTEGIVFFFVEASRPRPRMAIKQSVGDAPVYVVV